MKSITVNVLNQKSIQKALGDLKAYRAKMERLTGQIVSAMTDRLNELLQEEIAGAKESEAVSWTAKYDTETKTGYVALSGEAEFVEFGTGEVGERNHSGINEEWLDKLPPPYNVGYNTGPKIVHVQNGDDFWVYWKDGKFIKTAGIEANPFIYRAVTRLQDEYPGIVKEVARQNGIGQ